MTAHAIETRGLGKRFGKKVVLDGLDLQMPAGVPVSEAIVIYNALSNRQIPVELMIFPDEGHGAARRANRALAFGHRLAFFEKHLK